MLVCVWNRVKCSWTWRLLRWLCISRSFSKWIKIGVKILFSCWWLGKVVVWSSSSKVESTFLSLVILNRLWILRFHSKTKVEFFFSLFNRFRFWNSSSKTEVHTSFRLFLWCYVTTKVKEIGRNFHFLSRTLQNNWQVLRWIGLEIFSTEIKTWFCLLWWWILLLYLFLWWLIECHHVELIGHLLYWSSSKDWLLSYGYWSDRLLLNWWIDGSYCLFLDRLLSCWCWIIWILSILFCFWLSHILDILSEIQNILKVTCFIFHRFKNWIAFVYWFLFNLVMILFNTSRESNVKVFIIHIPDVMYLSLWFLR